MFILLFTCRYCDPLALSIKAKPVPTAHCITTVKIQRQSVRFLVKIKQETDILSVSCFWGLTLIGLDDLE